MKELFATSRCIQTCSLFSLLHPLARISSGIISYIFICRLVVSWAVHSPMARNIRLKWRSSVSVWDLKQVGHTPNHWQRWKCLIEFRDFEDLEDVAMKIVPILNKHSWIFACCKGWKRRKRVYRRKCTLWKIVDSSSICPWQWEISKKFSISTKKGIIILPELKTGEWQETTQHSPCLSPVPEEVASLPQVQRKLRKLEDVDQQLARRPKKPVPHVVERERERERERDREREREIFFRERNKM